MSINAVKGVELGAGFAVVEQRGTEHRDEMTAAGFLSNNAGGVLGGISTGQDIVASLALKPTSSLRLPGRSLNARGEEVEVVTTGRHDPCVGIRATPIAEAMLALVLMDHLMRQRAQNPELARPRLIAPELRSGCLVGELSQHVDERVRRIRQRARRIGDGAEVASEQFAIDVEARQRRPDHRRRQHAPAETDADEHADRLEIVRRHRGAQRQTRARKTFGDDAAGVGAEARQDRRDIRTGARVRSVAVPRAGDRRRR